MVEGGSKVVVLHLYLRMCRNEIRCSPAYPDDLDGGGCAGQECA